MSFDHDHLFRLGDEDAIDESGEESVGLLLRRSGGAAGNAVGEGKEQDEIRCHLAEYGRVDSSAG